MTLDAMTLDGRGDLHDQVAAAARRLISSGSIAPGARLPPARDLARKLGLNVNTVLRGYRQLAAEDLIELRRGRGATVVAAPDLARLHSLAEELVDEAIRLGLSRADVLSLLLSRL